MKRLLIPAIILGIAILIWVFQSKYEKSRTSGRLSEDFLGIGDGEITSIEFIQDSDSLIIYKENGGWYVKDSITREADMQNLGPFLETIHTLSVGAPVSDNPDRQSGYQVDDISGKILNLRIEDEIASALIVGKMSSDFTRAYIRLPGSNEVYVAPAHISYAFNLDREQWADKTIVLTNLAIIDTVEVKGKDDTFKFLKESGVWKVSRFPFNDTVSAKMQYASAFLQQICNLKGIRFLLEKDRASLDFRNPVMSMTLSLIDGSKEIIEFADVKTGDLSNYYCRKIGARDTLLVSKTTFDALYKSYADFLF
jgi:hypothetical protein